MRPTLRRKEARQLRSDQSETYARVGPKCASALGASLAESDVLWRLRGWERAPAGEPELQELVLLHNGRCEQPGCPFVRASNT
jgi:hypothetical protein